MEKAHNFSYAYITNMFLLHFLYTSSISLASNFVANRNFFTEQIIIISVAQIMSFCMLFIELFISSQQY